MRIVAVTEKTSDQVISIKTKNPQLLYDPSALKALSLLGDFKPLWRINKQKNEEKYEKENGKVTDISIKIK